jgi:hypothetical protein
MSGLGREFFGCCENVSDRRSTKETEDAQIAQRYGQRFCTSRNGTPASKAVRTGGWGAGALSGATSVASVLSARIKPTTIAA